MNCALCGEVVPKDEPMEFWPGTGAVHKDKVWCRKRREAKVAHLMFVGTDGVAREANGDPVERCACGEATGSACGNLAEVTVEWMPPVHRESHEVAQNRGKYPLNGALRLHVARACGESLVAADNEWVGKVGW